MNEYCFIYNKKIHTFQFNRNDKLKNILNVISIEFELIPDTFFFTIDNDTIILDMEKTLEENKIESVIKIRDWMTFC